MGLLVSMMFLDHLQTRHFHFIYLSIILLFVIILRMVHVVSYFDCIYENGMDVENSDPDTGSMFSASSFRWSATYSAGIT